jgi:hypothetical protein
MVSNTKGRLNSTPLLVLEDCFGACSDLAVIKTGSKYRKETIENVKRNLAIWMANDGFEPIKGRQLDVAIVIKCNGHRLKKQDADNMAKVVCDALKERSGDNR